MEHVEVKCIASQRGKKMLLINDYKFKKRKVLKSGLIYWVCSTDGCKARCYTAGMLVTPEIWIQSLHYVIVIR